MSLHVVRHHSGGKRMVCRLCKAMYWEGEERAFERHVVACGNAHEEEIHLMSPRTRLPMLTKEGGPDPEMESWVERNAPEIIRGAKRM